MSALFRRERRRGAFVQEICFGSWVVHAYIHTGALFSTVSSNNGGLETRSAMPLLIRFRLAEDLSLSLFPSRLFLEARLQLWGSLRETSWQRPFALEAFKVCTCTFTRHACLTSASLDASAWYRINAQHRALSKSEDAPTRAVVFRILGQWKMSDTLMFLTANPSNFIYVLTAQRLIEARVNRVFFI